MRLTNICLGLVALILACTTVGCQTTSPITINDKDVEGAPLSAKQVAFAEALAYYSQALMFESAKDFEGAMVSYAQAIERDPGNINLYFKYALGLLHEQRKDDAVAVMEQLVDRHPKSPKALRWLAMIYRAAEQLEASEATYRRWLKISPSDPTPYIQLASLYVRQGREAEAVVLLESSLQKVEDPLDVLRVVGEVHLRLAAASLTEADEKKFREDALEVYEQIVEANPDEPLGLSKLAELYALNQQYDKAITFYEGIGAKHPKNLHVKEKLAESFLAMGKQANAVEVLEDIADQQPDNPRVHTYLGELYQQMGDTKHAATSFRHAIDSDPEDPSGYLKLAVLLMSENAAEAKSVLDEGLAEIPNDETLTKTLAHVYFAEKKYEEACIYFERALKVMNQEEDAKVSPNFYFNYAVSAQRSAKIDKAAELLTLAMDDNVAYIDAYIQFVFRQEREEDMETAVQVLAKTAELQPGIPRIYYYTGMLSNYLKRYPESLVAFEKTIELAQDEETQNELLTSQFYFWYAAACERDGQIQRSVELFRKCIELDPEYAEAYNYLAYMWAERGENLEEALTFVKKALELVPESGAFVDTLGWIYYMQGRNEDALEQIEKASKLLPDDATIMEHLGDVLLRLGDVEKAVPTWKRSFVLDPANDTVGEKLVSHGVELAPLRVEADELSLKPHPEPEPEETPSPPEPVDDVVEPAEPAPVK